jgi:homoserine kinase type II
MTAPDPAVVLARWAALGPLTQIEARDMAGGWSGSLIWRVTAAGGTDYCLRRWPPAHPAPDRLRLIHAVLTHVSRCEIDYVPVPIAADRGNSFVEHEGHYWELTPWMPGQADFRDHPTPVRLGAAMHALARFHNAATGQWDRTSGTETQAAPAIRERLELVDQLQGGDLGRIAAAVRRGLSDDLDARAARILAGVNQRLAPLRQPLAAATSVSLPLSPAIRDVHHDHVLFTGQRVTGLVDFGALRIDTPLADVARLVGSLAGDDLQSRTHALAAYNELRPLADADRRLIDLLDASNVVLGGQNWLRWLYLDRRDMGPTGPILHRLDEIVQRLERPPRLTDHFTG